MLRRSILVALFGLLGNFAHAAQEAARDASRGELLYGIHCVTCHTTQMHWRNDRQALDWDSLKFQVRRWQGNAGLAWNEADIAEVSRYLNETIYHYPQLNDRVGLVPSRSNAAVPSTPRK